MKHTVLVFLSLIFLISCGSGDKIVEDYAFSIQQKKEYINPEFKSKKIKKKRQTGPYNGKTYIDDADIQKLGDLKKYYPLPKMYKYAVLQHSKNNLQPVIVTPKGEFHSFLVENNILTYDTKVVAEENGKKKIKFETELIDKKK